jgi:hypothetical protein
MSAASASHLRPARPTIAVDGRDRAELAERLISLEIAEDMEGLYRCEAVFGNWGSTKGSTGFLYFDRTLLEFAKPLQVKLGTDAIFDGRIMALEGRFPEGSAAEIGILAEDRLQDLRMTRRTRTFENASDADVFQQIAGDHSLTPQITLNGPTHKVLAQANQSDLAFLRERARLLDAEIWLDGANLNIKAHSARGGNPLQIAWGRDLRSFEVLADLAGQRSKVSVSGWDVSGKSAIRFDAGDSAISAELGATTSGVSILSQKIADRTECLAHTTPFTTQEAQAVAEAFFRISARRFLTGRGIAEADSRLRVGATVELQGLGPLFSGKYYVSGSRHLFDAEKGLRTEFTCQRPGIGQP